MRSSACSPAWSFPHSGCFVPVRPPSKPSEHAVQCFAWHDLLITMFCSCIFARVCLYMRPAQALVPSLVRLTCRSLHSILLRPALTRFPTPFLSHIQGGAGQAAPRPLQGSPIRAAEEQRTAESMCQCVLSTDSCEIQACKHDGHSRSLWLN
eukprot:scaffold35047_cov18-Tisochrysis_lutea.AAC.4